MDGAHLMPYKDPEQRREYQRLRRSIIREEPELMAAERATAQRRYQQNHKPSLKPFAGVDGEGCTLLCSVCERLLELGRPFHGCRVTVPGGFCGQHRYVLIRAGHRVLKDDAGLSWKQILPWLTDHQPDFEYVSFFFDYDVTMILRGADWCNIVRLVKEGKAWFGDYFCTYMPRKEFKVTRMLAKGGKWVKDPDSTTMRISDTCTFFQTAFVNVIRDWEALTPELRDQIGAGKERRAVLQHLDGETEEYNRLECEALAEVMEKLRAACHDMDLRPRKWQGPANITRAMFAKHRVPRREDYERAIPKQVLEIGRCAYYGGRFENAIYGFVPGPVSELDLAGAYPAALAGMPCIVHAKWTHGGPDPDATIDLNPKRPRLLKVRTRAKETAQYYGLPYRDKDGGVWWPTDVEGWYWDFEIAQARHQTVQILETWTWEPMCECPPPFAWNLGVFQERRAMGKTGKGRVLKLGANSEYGLMAQTIGAPVYACHVLASYITAWCRARIMEAIHTHGCEAFPDELCGSRVVMTATDALFVVGEPRVPLTDELGGWELKEHPEGLFCVQAGVYFGAHAAKPKTRGTPMKLVAQRREDFEDAYRDMVRSADPRRGDVYVPVQRFVGLRDAVHRGNAAKLGTFVWVGADSERPGKRIGFDWASKRDPEPVSMDPDGMLVTRPRDPDADVRSHRYPKQVPLLDRQTDDTPEEWGQISLF